MSIYQDRIQKELEIGDTYTEREISTLLYFGNDRIFVLCDGVSHFNSKSLKEFKVIQKYSAYLHRHERNSYVIPSQKSLVYIVETV
ncbi:hypothetical protein QUF88_19110 [Bacillus sp. DX1.1]|uniref:hypothetical protein n=1 Tax=unclassified Bacillus (in: firmicutes) TaxID=185979 RepID=UPI002570B2AD|nr:MULTISPECIES: hypothetical protein [unclassified Bacillus (in: firmicutes)]MDM5155823.1 hypothetical protein [Bacillus sp. DX1.1]WJE80121.1 hypothetical protein QRE67_16640 [Bacillus sp. DX3.1]